MGSHKKRSNRQLRRLRSGLWLENLVDRYFRKLGFETYVRVNSGKIDVVAFKGELLFVVECKNYRLTKHTQILAVRQLNQNYPLAIEFLKEKEQLIPKVRRKVLIARSFHHQSKGMLQYTVSEIQKNVYENGNITD